MKKLLFRPKKTPSENIILGTRSVGHYILNKNETGGEFKHFAQIFWCTQGKGIHTINGNELTLTPNQIAIYHPNMKQQYIAIDNKWEYYFFTLDGSLVKDVLSKSDLHSGVYNVGPAPIKLFEQLESTIQNHGFNAEIYCSNLAFQLISQCIKSTNIIENNPLINNILNEIDHRWHSKEFNINYLANKYQIHRTTLTRRFKAVMRISPMEYLLNLKIEHAKILLKESQQSIGEISFSCGFEDPNYFSRIFKTKIGMTAKKFRMKIESF
jgi:AraC-like DNA-binding protein